MIIVRALRAELLAPFCTVLAILMGLLVTNQFVHYMEEAATGTLTVADILIILSLQLPTYFAYLVPMAWYLALLITLGRWRENSEWTAMRVGGLGHWTLLSRIIALAVAVAMMVALMSFWVQPLAEQKRSHLLEHAWDRTSVDKLIAQQFQEIGHGQVVYAKKVDRAHQQLDDVFYARHLANGHWTVIVAQRANQMKADQVIAFSTGYQYDWRRREQHLAVMQFSQYFASVSADDLHHSSWPHDLSPRALYQQMQQPDVLNDYPMLVAEWHWRLALPLSVIMVTALAYLLAQLPSRRSRLAQMVPALLLYLVYAECMIVGRSWLAAGQSPSWLGLWWAHGMMVVVGIGVWCLSRRLSWGRS